MELTRDRIYSALDQLKKAFLIDCSIRQKMDSVNAILNKIKSHSIRKGLTVVGSRTPFIDIIRYYEDSKATFVIVFQAHRTRDGWKSFGTVSRIEKTTTIEIDPDMIGPKLQSEPVEIYHDDSDVIFGPGVFNDVKSQVLKLENPEMKELRNLGSPPENHNYSTDCRSCMRITEHEYPSASNLAPPHSSRLHHPDQSRGHSAQQHRHSNRSHVSNDSRDGHSNSNYASKQDYYPIEYNHKQDPSMYGRNFQPHEQTQPTCNCQTCMKKNNTYSRYYNSSDQSLRSTQSIQYGPSTQYGWEGPSQSQHSSWVSQ